MLAGAAGFVLFARSGAKAGPLRGAAASCTDEDGDGYGIGCAAGPDCNDHDPAMHPGAVETCNFKDDDCNGLVDEAPGCVAPALDAEAPHRLHQHVDDHGHHKRARDPVDRGEHVEHHGQHEPGEPRRRRGPARQLAAGERRVQEGVGLGALVGFGLLRWFSRSRGPVEFDQRTAIAVESMGLYWHFVDIVWIVIFTAVYLIEYL